MQRQHLRLGVSFCVQSRAKRRRQRRADCAVVLDWDPRGRDLCLDLRRLSPGRRRRSYFGLVGQVGYVLPIEVRPRTVKADAASTRPHGRCLASPQGRLATTAIL
eukprot:6180499-Pleurochrysis_carterae.AAC.2